MKTQGFEHTPGEWTLQQYGRGAMVVVGERLIADCKAARGSELASCEANARLIVAAPKMSALLREALDDWPQFDTDDDVNGGDMVDWFAQWRIRVREALGAGGIS